MKEAAVSECRHESINLDGHCLTCTKSGVPLILAIRDQLAAALRERDGLVAAGKRIMAMHCGPPDGVGNWDAAFDQLEAALAAIRGMEGSQAASGSGKSDGGNG